MPVDYEAAISSPQWYALKDLVRLRARNLCEWCRRRPMAILHHRTYANVGYEQPADVMGVCHACHKAIHGRLPWTHGQPPTMVVGVGSLADLGDPGMGDSALWDAYLKSTTTPEARRQLGLEE